MRFEPQDGLSRRVLIIDDSAHIRRSLRCIIEEDLGWQVCGEATNGADGVTAATSLRPDVVVVDLSMPVMNGIEAARQLKRLVPESQLLVLTSFPTPCAEEAARMVGIEAFVAKSDGAASLIENLQRLSASPTSAG